MRPSLKVEPKLEDVLSAYEKIQGVVHHTPVLTITTLDQIAGAKLFFKCENFQKVGAFKFRGASHAVMCLTDDEAQRGVVTHSSGNHAQALALAARIRGIPAFIVMPSNSPEVKKAAVKGYGGIITFCDPTLKARESTVCEIVERTSATFIHPYNDSRVIAGQGTAALEFLREFPSLDILVAPVGGGGLLSGTAVAAKGIKPTIRVWGAEPEGADDAYRSLRDGVLYPPQNPKTIADGLLTSLGDLTFSVIKQKVDGIVRVSESEIKLAMRFVWERMKIIIEPSSAVPVAAVLFKKFSFENQRVGIILSGGNVDLTKACFELDIS